MNEDFKSTEAIEEVIDEPVEVDPVTEENIDVDGQPNPPEATTPKEKKKDISLCQKCQSKPRADGTLYCQSCNPELRDSA